MKKMIMTFAMFCAVCVANAREVVYDCRANEEGSAAVRADASLSDAWAGDRSAMTAETLSCGDVVVFQVADDRALTLNLKTVRETAAGRMFSASVGSGEGVLTSVLLQRSDLLVANIRDLSAAQVWTIEVSPSAFKVRRQVVSAVRNIGCCAQEEEHDHDSESACEGETRAVPRLALAAAPAATAEPCVVDMLIVVDRGAAIFCANQGWAVSQQAEIAVEKMNLALANTGIDSYFRFRLKGVMLFDGVIGTDVTAAVLKSIVKGETVNGTDLKAIHERRDAIGADLVSVWIDAPTSAAAGLAYTYAKNVTDAYGYSLCDVLCAVYGDTMTHEVGHNLGAGHSTAQSYSRGPGYRNYSSGAYFSAAGVKYCTIMAYSNDGPGGWQIPYFSSPNYTYNGVATGDATHDNTRTLIECGSLVAAYRDGGDVNPADCRVDGVIFSPAPGKFTGSTTVSLASTEDGGVVHYTLDGSAPTLESPVWSGEPLTLTRTTLIRAVSETAGVCGKIYDAMYCTATLLGQSTPVGRLQVTTKGVSADWYVTKDTATKYPSGAVVSLPVGQYKVKFVNPDPETFATPDPVTAYVLASSGAADICTVTGVFTDLFDPADDVLATPTGHASITPVSNESVAKRTLWADDANDWFKIKAAPGLYYNFELVDTTSGSVGDACFTLVSAASGAVPVATNVVSFKKRALPVPAGVTKQVYRLGVHHANEPAVDSSYSLRYSVANVGVLSFGQSEYVTKDTSTYKSVYVTRSASDGAVRVRYATVAGSAKPGVNYYPTEGVLSWEDGDMSPKEIRIRLIPDVEPKWEEARVFSVRLSPVSEENLDDDEYPACLAEGGDVARVRIKETAVMKPGAVEIVDTPQSYTLVDDCDTTIRIVRRGGADGRLRVTAKTIDKDAVAGVDYRGFSLTHTWEAGDTNDWVVALHLNEPTGRQASKQFIVKLSCALPDATFVTPEIPVAKTYFTIVNGFRGSSVSELNEAMSPSGVGLIASSEKWHTDVAGDFVSDDIGTADAAKAQFTVTGPGFFICSPDVIGGVGKFIGTLRSADNSMVKEFKVRNGEINTIAVPDWAKVVCFKFKCTGGPAHANFAQMHGGLPFKWIPLSEFAPAQPQNKSVLESADELAWSIPDLLKRSDNIWCRVYIGNRGSKVAKITNLLTNFTQEASCRIPAAFSEKGASYWWRIECAHMSDPDADADTATWLQVPSVWKFSVAAAGVPRTGIGTNRGSPWTDVNGDDIVAGRTIELVEGVFQNFSLTSDAGASSMSLVAGALPSGMKLDAASCLIAGTPNAAGDYSALLQVSNDAAAGTTLKVDFHVAAMGSAAGSYNGTLMEVGSQLKAAYPRVGRIYNVKVSDNGSVSAKVKLAGRSWSFSASAFDRIVDRDESVSGWRMTYEVEMENVQYIGSVAYTNVLLLSIGSHEISDVVAYGEISGSARLLLNVPSEDGLSVEKDIVYQAELMRYGDSPADYADALKSFAGYYTVSLVPTDVSAEMGVPCGNGYVTMSVTDNGVVTVAGMLADGTAISCSCNAQVTGDVSDPGSCVLNVPLCAYASHWSFGGLLRIRGGKVDSTSTLTWTKDGKASTFDRRGFVLAVQPVGGWYNTTSNLQAYYLSCDFSVEAESVTGLPSGMLPAGNDYTIETMPHDVEMILEGNVTSVATREYVHNTSSPALYDLASSVNPWNTTVTFTRATGLVKGTFQAWSDGATQKSFATLNHYGVLLMNRDEASLLDADVWTAGFYLLPVTSTWTASLPFNIRQTEVDRDWCE